MNLYILKREFFFNTIWQKDKTMLKTHFFIVNKHTNFALLSLALWQKSLHEAILDRF